MSFQSLVGGADCGPSNGLQSLMKHSQTDRSLQQGDRTNAPSSLPGASFRQGRQAPGPTGPSDAQAFFGNAPPPQLNGDFGPMDGAFQFDKMRTEMERMQRSGNVPSGWAQEMSRIPQQAPHADLAGAWRQQFSTQPSDAAAAARSSNGTPTPSGASTTARPGTYGGGMMGGFGGMGMMSGGMMGQGSIMRNSAQRSETSAQNSRFTELSDKQWEEEFARLDAAEAEAATDKGKGKGKASEELDTEEEQDRKVREALDRLETDVRDEGLNADRRFEELWNAMHANGAIPPSGADAELKRFEELMQRQREKDAEDDEQVPDLDEWAYTHPSGGLGGGVEGLHERGRFDGTEDHLMDGYGTTGIDGFPRLGAYRFAQENPFSTHENPMAEGLRLLANGGSLADAALLFEAATQRDVEGGSGGELQEVNRALREKSEAWRRLGEAMAMNERETQAIRAFEEAVKLDENNLEAYMALAISYTNEGYDAAAHTTLERYMAKAYPHITASAPPEIAGSKDPIEGTEGNPWASLNKVTEMFLSAAREGASKGVIDPEIQVGLGVLFYSNSSYEEAKDCFQTALQARPNDFLLWNRLGATLANGGKPEEAIEAYHKALELRPTFTRAIYNLSVSCLNLGAHHEAAEHLLAALSLQQSHAALNLPEGSHVDAPRPPPLAEAQESHNLWSTLRRIFIVMERMDLAQHAHVGADLAQFHKAGFEF
ncbi:TPR repeat-containing protein [Ceraceosorus bombacis]|uniref:TPR repeat-containing protein n=1 Tax=Ceraceosorus bombacis TaxID=401625 RepID=A0A0P1BJS9_9BASI|nr:TPR repeat-containing protein [Ceraceosorus bombacis]